MEHDAQLDPSVREDMRQLREKYKLILKICKNPLCSFSKNTHISGTFSKINENIHVTFLTNVTTAVEEVKYICEKNQDETKIQKSDLEYRSSNSTHLKNKDPQKNGSVVSTSTSMNCDQKRAFVVYKCDVKWLSVCFTYCKTLVPLLLFHQITC